MEKNYKIEDFITREEFIKRTGIFVTPEYFEYVYHKWVNESEKTGISVDDFVDNYEKNHIGQVAETEMNGTFKYLIMDESVSAICDDGEIFDPSIWDIVNSLACNLSNEREEKQKTINDATAIMDNMYKLMENMYEMLNSYTDILERYKSIFNEV